MNKKKIYYWLLLPVLALMMGACSKTDDDNGGGNTPKLPETNVALSEEDCVNFFSELVARSVMHGIAPDAPCNDVTRYWQLVELLANQPTTASTRGLWSGILAAYNFKKVASSTKATHRATLIGAMVKSGKMDKKSREQIWHQIMNAKKNKSNDFLLDNQYRMGCDEFWEKFSKGELDGAAYDIYHAVFAENVESKQTAAQELAEYLLDNNLREIDMTLKCAGPLISAGADVVFALGDDLIQYGKLAYDFVETNTGFVLQAVEGNLTSEKCIDTMNFNLKLLTKKLKEIVPTTQDLTEVLSDLTADQLKALQKEIQNALDDASGMQLSKNELDWFTQRAKDILHIDWKPGFLDQEYVNDTYDLTISIESPSGKGCYTFYCTDKNGNVLLEGRCALSPTTITLYVTYIEKGCERILPKSGKVTVGDMLFIPYNDIGFSSEGVDILWLWYNSTEQSDIYFNLKKDTEIEASPTELTFEAEGGEQTVNVDKKSYPYCGGFTDSDCEDWITIKNVSDGVFTVTAAPNNTDKERTGTIYAFATNSMNPTKDDIVLLPIKVKQKAGDTSGDTSQQQQITEVEISSFKFKTGLYANCTQNHYNENGKLDKTEEYVSGSSFEGGYMDQSFTAENITSSFSGSTLHVKAEYEYRGQKYDVSFDVTGITGDYKEARVTSLTCKRVISESVFGHEKYNFTATYSNIPVNKIGKKSASDPLSLSRMTFEGTPANGMGISGYSCEKYTYDGWGGYTHYHFDYLDNAANFATLVIEFKSVK